MRHSPRTRPSSIAFVVFVFLASFGLRFWVMPDTAPAQPAETVPTLPMGSASAQAAAAAPGRPLAVQGVLHIPEDMLPLPNLPLDGQWEFYWQHLIAPEAFDDPDFDIAPLYIDVPGGWTALETSPGPLPGQGYGTYRLRVVLPEDLAELAPLALYIPYVRTSHNLFVNDRLVAARGEVGSGRASSTPAGGTEVVSVPMSEAGMDAPNELDIVVHVANFSFRQGGLGRSILLGTEKNIRAASQRSLAWDMLLAATLFVIGLYHIGMWIIRPGDRHLLFFGLFSLVIALRNAVMDQAPALLFFPDLPWELLLKVEYIGYYMGVPLIVLFMHYLYPDEYDKRIVNAVVMVGVAFSVFVLVTPGRINSHALFAFHIVTLMVLVFIVHGLLLARRRERPGAHVIFVAALIVTVIVIHDILFYWDVLKSRGLVPVSLLGMVAAYSFVLSKKFSDEFDRQRRLMKENTNLLRMVNEQIIQIKDSRRLMHEREERIRREVAEMLHGSVQSRLLAAQHHLRKLTNFLQTLQSQMDPPQDELDVALHNAARASEQLASVNEIEIRRLSHLLHPMLLRIGLVPALESLARRFAGQIDVEIRAPDELSASNQEGTVAVAEPVSLAMYRIVEEALSNVVKHAQAGRAVVELTLVEGPEGHMLQGVVTDDGIGIRPRGRAAAQLGFGMQMMAARVEEIGGTWSIDRLLGHGTVVRVRLPLAEGDASGRVGRRQPKRMGGGGHDVSGGEGHEHDQRH